MSADFESLFAEAEENLKKQEIPDDWGYLRRTEEGDRVLCRFLAFDELPPFGDEIIRCVSYPGEPEPFYLKATAQLRRVFENAGLGDLVGAVRGFDRDVGRERPMQTWDGWIRPCNEPLGVKPGPGNDTTPDATEDDGIPF
jgi:hypothetical protein